MESITLISRDKTEAAGQADITRFDSGARMRRGLPFMVGGVIAGILCIPIPGVHFVGTWALPIIGFVVGRYYMNSVVAKVGALKGECPACGDAFEVDEVGNWESPMHVRCSKCRAPLNIQPEQAVE